MKQIGLGLHNYHSIQRLFPAGMPPQSVAPDERRLQTAIHARMPGCWLPRAAGRSTTPTNFTSASATTRRHVPVNSTVTTTRLNVFLCPSVHAADLDAISLDPLPNYHGTGQQLFRLDRVDPRVRQRR